MDIDRILVNAWADDFERRFFHACVHGQDRNVCAECKATLENFNQRLANISAGRGTVEGAKQCNIQIRKAH